MEQGKTPKLRVVNKSEAIFPLNDFPANFPFILGKELVYLLATKGKPDLEGNEWENIFATCIGAEWKHSNIGLDDVTLGSMAWCAKTVKAKNPVEQKRVRLISGRNSPIYSFGERIDTEAKPESIGRLVLDIWNERVSAIRAKYKHLRTVVLVRSDDLSTVCVFEFDTVRYDNELYQWDWNKNKNLIGTDKKTKKHRFTWQPHGSQFTIIEEVPNKHLIIRIKQPQALDKEQVLQTLKFDKSWIAIEKKG